MLLSARQSYEKSNEELLFNTINDMGNLKQRYLHNKRTEIVDTINLILYKSSKNCRKMIQIISEQEKYKHEFRMFLDLNYMKKIASEESSETTSFYQLNSIEEIIKKYKLIYLLLMRIVLGTISDIDNYLVEIMEVYSLTMEDLVFVAQIENLNF